MLPKRGTRNGNRGKCMKNRKKIGKQHREWLTKLLIGLRLAPVFHFSRISVFVLSFLTAVFSRAVFQVAQRVTSGSPVKTVVFSTRLKLSESANFNGILIKFKPVNQVA